MTQHARRVVGDAEDDVVNVRVSSNIVKSPELVNDEAYDAAIEYLQTLSIYDDAAAAT